VEWVEVRGPTVEVAVTAALEELKLASIEQAEVNIIQEPEKGFLGFGGRDAIVQVKPKPAGTKRRRRRRGKGSGDGEQAAGAKSADQPRRQSERPKNDRRPSKQQSQKPEEPPVNREQQGEVVRDFLVGLLNAFGLEGDVNVTVDDEIVLATVDGEQTEALVGPKAAITQSVLELSRTVVQRQTRDNVRLRLDIAGYGQRRREALAIYAGRLAEQVVDEGSEIMLEPMNAADRKVIHDAVSDIEGVRSYSEGEDPHRSVVIAPAD